MAEYIERAPAVEAAAHAWAKGLEPSQYIEIIPAADVAPVRHGRWEQGDMYDYGDVCSLCDWDSERAPCTLPYCPDCGAKMEPTP